MYSISDRSDDLAGQGNMSTLCRARFVITAALSPLNGVHKRQCYKLNYQTAISVFGINTRVLLLSYIKNCSPDHNSSGKFSVSKPQAVCLLAFSRPPSDQHTAINATKAEHDFLRKHNRYPLRPPMISSLTPLASEAAMAWSQWNTRYRAPSSELSLK
ncbi:uncharacterized protein TNCV_376011 [Trichonephila clavipes]|nr:uncharacterized protein TNCV_376011 [Trichonephila clavipes]